MIQLEPKDLKIVKQILGDLISNVRVFGSRAKGVSRSLSDLDLVFIDPPSREHLSSLKNAFEESNLPFKVDIIIWNDISEGFKKHIQHDLTEF